MAITPSELLLIIKAKDQATSTLKNLSGESKTLDKNMGSLGKSIQSSLGGLLGGGAGMLLTGGLMAGLAAIGKSVIARTAELATMGRESSRVAAGFKEEWGIQAPAAMERLRQASKGAISDMDLQLAANRASMLQVTNDANELAALLQVAVARGQKLGISSAEAFDNIVTGIGRMSLPILDNLGILTGGQKVFDNYAASIGKASNELSDVEKRQALVNLVISEAGEVTADAATQTEALAAAKDNLNRAMGEGIAEIVENSGAIETQIGIIRELTDVTRDFFDVLEGRDALGQYKDELKAAYDQGKLSAARYYELSDAVLLYRQRMAIMGKTEEETTAAIREKQDALREEIGAMTEAEIAAADLHESQVRNAAAAYQAAEAFRTAGVAAVNMGRDYSWAASMQLNAGEVYTGSSQYVYGMKSFGDRGAIDAYLEYYKSQREYASDTAKAEASIYKDRLSTQRSYAAESQRIAQQQYEAVRGIVESVLRPTQVTAADLAATAAGTYVDKWDEAVRRFRMVEKGHTPEEISEYERKFYGGYLLEDVNWAAIVEDVKQKLADQAAKEALIEEAMRQVRMAGITASDAQLSAAMGVTDYQAMGEEYGQELAAGLSATGLAAMYTDDFENEFALEQDRWRTMGVMSVGWMVEGISQGATQDAVDKLVNVLINRVIAALGGRASGSSGNQSSVRQELQAAGVGY